MLKLGVAGPSRLAVRTCPKRAAYRAHSTGGTRLSVEGNSDARLRFAPSPTGFLHLGGLRTALFNHLLARKWGGKWMLRIEDTDQSRLVDGSVDSLRRTLEWAGLDYDEGVGVGGSHGPYTQSERLELYHHHIRDLVSRDKAYECFCTADELTAMRAQLHKQGHRHTYDGRCRHLTEEERGRRRRAGEKHVVRFKADVGGGEIPRDLIHGDVQFPAQSSMPDDVVLLKSDGYPTYHLASVVDDHEMRISHVLRGEEWLPSVPKHHALYRAFGWTPPQFAHLPLLVNMDGTKLSKRQGDVKVDWYREQGYEPEALLNFLALMGWDHHSALAALSPPTLNPTPSPPADDSVNPSPPPTPSEADMVRSDSHTYYDIFTPAELISAFSLKHVNTKKAAVNLGKLDFINKITLRRKAGRLGKEGVMVAAGKAGLTGSRPAENVADGHEGMSLVEGEGESAERADLVDRLQGLLREKKVLQGNPLVEDRAYVEKVFDAELARAVVLPDIASSIFLFLRPEYDNHEAKEMIKTINPVKYISLCEAMHSELQARLDDPELAAEPTEELAWRAIHAVVRAHKARKVELLTPMRHALTGRLKGPGVPAIMNVLGVRESMARLEEGLRFVRQRMRGGQ